MDEPTDSMGSLVRPETSSSKAISQPGLNAKLLGTEFERHADSEIVHRSLYRLVAVYGDPWGSDRSRAKVMAEEWQTALADLPALVVDGAVTEWMRGHAKWPRPSDIRALADTALRRPIEAAAQRHGLHPRRIEPAESMKGFVFHESTGLRRHAIWKRWLDAQHPMVEHEMFARATCVEPHEIYGLTEFEADYIRQKFGRELTAHFGRAVGLGIGPHPCREILWTDDAPRAPTQEEIQRVSKAMDEFRKRNRDTDAKPVKPSAGGRGVSLDGASDAFRALVGADPLPDCGDTSRPPPNTAAIDSQSPHTASDDFSESQ